jgi:hypothetical protein
MTQLNGKRFVHRLLALAACCAALSLTANPAGAGQEKLVESNEYKDSDFHKGCIGDYQDLVEGDEINWVWIAPGVRLGDYKVTIGKISDLTDDLVKAQMEEISGFFQEYFGKLKGDKGTLKADVCFYETQKFSAGKAWIPFAGGHQMQAGFGSEVILYGNDGKVVAKIRHFAREGGRVEEAGREVAEDLKKFISKN